jgi:hypothetical protein
MVDRGGQLKGEEYGELHISGLEGERALKELKDYGQTISWSRSVSLVEISGQGM